ncbi:MAG: hypothetical protein ACUVRH_06395 [Candidatus Bipolaricaulia bacterium]
MVERVLVALVALAAISVFSTEAFAGVDGSFKFDIWAWPQTTTSEASTFNFDFEALLWMDIALSGMAIGNRLAMGLAGLEHYIISLDAFIEALDFRSKFVFAVPFIGCPSYKPVSYRYIDLFRTYGPFTDCRPVGDLLFIKKRVSFALGEGIHLSSLLLLEDANFPKPTQGSLTSAQDPNGNGVYEASEQRFRFGYIFEMIGTTVFLTDIEARIGFCADWRIWEPLLLFLPKFYWLNDPGVLEEAVNEIKKYRWYETVCDRGEPLIKEFISLEGIELTPDLWLDTYIITSLNPFSFDIYTWASYTLPLKLGTLYTRFHSGRDLALDGPAGTAVMLKLDGLKLLWHDADGDWTMSPADKVVGSMGVDYQSASFLIDALAAPTLGLQALLLEVDLPISHPVPIGALEVTARWATPTYAASLGETVAHEGMVWDAIDFELSRSFGEDNTLMIEAQYGAQYAGSGTVADPYRIVGYGLRAIDFQLEVVWWL